MSGFIDSTVECALQFMWKAVGTLCGPAAARAQGMARRTAKACSIFDMIQWLAPQLSVGKARMSNPPRCARKASALAPFGSILFPGVSEPLPTIQEAHLCMLVLKLACDNT